MGLQSAMTVSLTGLQAAETVIDVVGNNVANSGTVGFKESDVLFATQFLQTQSIGSAPTTSTGGTNPRQIGLGVKIASINPDFTQGTIQISSNPLDVAIQGDGFLIAEGAQGEQLYTRNGQLQTNSQNEVVNANGNRILGLPVDENFEIDETRGLAPIQIPLGSQVVAQATQNAFFAGNLNPSFDIGTSGILTSQELGDGTIQHPIDASGAPGNTFDSGEVQVVSAPNVSGATGASAATGALATGDYAYRVVWYKNSGPNSYESAPSSAISVTGVPASGEVTLNNLPVDASTTWDGRRIYRSFAGGPFQLLESIATTGATYADDGSVAITATPLDLSAMDQNEYSYYVTFVNSTEGIESRPSTLIGPFAISDAVSRIRIDNLPQPTQTGFDRIRIYRNVNNSTSEFHRIAELDTGITTYIDGDDDLSIQGNPEIDLVGAKASASTRLTDVVLRTGDSYTQPFQLGTLSFAGEKGGRDLAAKELEIDANTTVNDLRNFMVQSYGMDTTIDGAGGSLNADGQLVFTSNSGIENEVGTGLASFIMDPTGPANASPISFSFDNTTAATGEGTTTSFVVFDSLGEPLNVRLTTVKVAETSTTFTYRWFATSADNEPVGSVNTFLGSGVLDFDRNGNIDTADARPELALLHPQDLPLIFNLDFNSVSGLSETNAAGNPTSDLSLTLQDGFPPGSLTSFTITESGLIRGVFSNGAERPLGQLQMARFANTAGLQQVGTNLFAEGVNSGEPIIDDPGAQGLGSLTSGAVELSNSDIGQNLIDLILASTQYRGGARVITTAQQLLDELLNLRR